ncbi:AI-2E family transporter [Umezakia ovalisporum]|uniref:AI-2E family transporter n=2 Tax=Umezakia ovalisporum TaxID=75695 RepID=A0AA43KG17_9CYAN|nr:AI-2E family transporter [Umezakia ovalisporum]MDH6057187.1 AI-2E family transporter [Umezakia ovalisporum FSS-43]MDH6064635.1 AI-2E family transporter [Umezakia ovalisporum FSS-62]MDH6069037.1 AI-2E family transporter [Umezakia ovalisporum APH033B]MDH6071727.1 AI-2E family transporter [Umezakia ovalisporum CobakiLakeA]MDH6073385.1 AI-2E family transporter [Umezakia ovalisporum CS-1034]
MNLGQWIGLIAIVLSLYILWQIRQVLLLIFAAVVLAVSLNRLAQRIQRLGFKPGLAVFLSVAILFVGILSFFWLIVPPFVQQFQELTYRVPQGFARFNSWLQQLETLIPSQLLPYIPNLNSLIEQVQPFLNQILGNSFAFVSGSLEVLLKVLLVLVLTGMFLAEPQAYRRLFIRLFPSFYRSRIHGILDQCELSLEGWIAGAFIAMSVVGIFSVIGLSVLGVKAALALGVLAGFLNLIPNLGPTLSLVPAMAIALLDNPWKPFLVFVLYFIIQQIDANIVTPTVMAHRVSLLPAVTLISQLFFVTFFGFLGLFLALPLTVVAKIWLQEVLIKDVLDEWGNIQHQEPELVLISQPSISDIDNKIENPNSNQNPKIDDALPQEE